MKCRACKKELPRSEFEKWRRICKRCHYNKRDLVKERASNNRYYARNRENIAAKTQTKWRAFKTWFDGLKANPCRDCGETYPPYVMDWDHVRGMKKFNLGALCRQWKYKSTKRLVLIEVKKCELVCANCHRERTQQRLA